MGEVFLKVFFIGAITTVLLATNGPIFVISQSTTTTATPSILYASGTSAIQGSTPSLGSTPAVASSSHVSTSTATSSAVPVAPGTTDNTSPPVPTTPDPCLTAHVPREQAFQQCEDAECAKTLLEALELSTRCGKAETERFREHPTKMPMLGEMLAENITKNITESHSGGQPLNTTSIVIATKQLALGVSVLHGSMATNTTRGMFTYPNMSEDGVSQLLGDRIQNSIMYPRRLLSLSPPGLIGVAWSISHVAGKQTVPESEIEPFRDIAWRLPISDMKIEKNNILIKKEKPHLAINSAIITFTLVPRPQTPLSEPLLIAFRRTKSSGVKNHGCYYWATSSPITDYWSSIGSGVVSSNGTHTVCSYDHMSTFVVLSELHDAEDDDARNAVRIVAIVLSILAMAAVGGTIYISRKLECLDNERVNIHVNLCVMLFIGYFLFIIGVLKNDVKVLNEILSVSLHFCQLSPFVWLALEAVYLLTTIHPIFDYENTNPRRLYTSLGWALTAAFAGASVGYDFPHNGRPFSSEIVWIFINKTTVWYFFGPFLFFFVINALLRLGLVIRLIQYSPTSDNDKAPVRIKVNILTSLVLAGVVFAAWCLGVQAVNHSEAKGYHYGFIVLYCLQAFLVLIIYGWKNEEMWSLHSKRKEEALKIKEKKISFTYVP